MKRPLPIGINPPLFRQTDGGFIPLFLNKPHHLFPGLNSLPAVISDSEPEKDPGKAHHADADFPVCPGDSFDRRDRIAVHIDDIVEKMDCCVNGFRQMVPIDFVSPGNLF